MPGLLVSDMTREGLRPFFERADQTRTLGRAEVAEFLDGTDIVTSIIVGYWQHAKSLMNRGVEHSTLVAAVKDVAEWIDHTIRAYQKVRSDAQGFNVAAGDLAALDKIVQTLQRMKTATVTQLHWLETPLPIIDTAALPAGKAEPNAKGFIGLDEFAARLRSRNPA